MLRLYLDLYNIRKEISNLIICHTWFFIINFKH